MDGAHDQVSEFFVKRVCEANVSYYTSFEERPWTDLEIKDRVSDEFSPENKRGGT